MKENVLSYKENLFRRIKPRLRDMLQSLWTRSLVAAAKEQNMDELSTLLRGIVPDLSEQYSTFRIDNPYLERKVRNQHSFQVSLVNRVIEEFDHPVVVDIGDSAGTHQKYLRGLHSGNKEIKSLSVNIDRHAVEKIRSKGLEAIHARAEELDKYDVNADIFLCFEVLEHLMDPIQFLHELSTKTAAKYLLITVPYLRKSRVALHHIRLENRKSVYAENTHIFEFSPEDWRLIFQHSGWSVHFQEIYRQYPNRGFYGMTKRLWRKYDFEGFYGVVLARDPAWSTRYMDW